MTRGGLIFAHNSRDIDYALLSIISGGLAKKYLDIPLTLVTDESTVEWMHESNIWNTANSVFEKITIVDRPVTDNARRLHDGLESKTIPFINSTRADAWDLTPYDQTLLLDSDYLIFSDQLNNYWDLDSSVMISQSMNDIRGDRIGFLDKNVSETGVHLFWATNVMFTKNKESKLFFELVKDIKINYNQYSDVYRFDSRQYRNDIAFSVAKHFLDGFETNLTNTLPSLLTVMDQDMLCDVDANKLLFLIAGPLTEGKYQVCAIKNTDVHIMNKQSIIRHKEKLLELI
jgi:hypothetical protein